MTGKLTRHLLLIVILGALAVSFLFDWLGLKNLGLFNVLNYIHEGISVFIIWLIYLYLKSFRLFTNKNVQHNLKIVAVNLITVYLTVFILKQIFQPQFVTIGFPPQTNDFKTIVYSNLVSLLGLFSMVGFIFALRNLIFYKPKKTRDFISIPVCLF